MRTVDNFHDGVHGWRIPKLRPDRAITDEEEKV